MLTAADAERLERCLRDGGVALFPADTVYGVACAAEDERAVERLYAIKGRPPAKPAAVMLFDVAAALALVPAQAPRTRALVEALLPGGVTVLLDNPERRFPLACGPDPTTLGLRVPALGAPLAALAAVRTPILQSSANRSGGPDARTLADVSATIRLAVDLALDGGELPGTPSTVLDLRAYERAGEWTIVRQGAVPEAEIARLAR